MQAGRWTASRRDPRHDPDSVRGPTIGIAEDHAFLQRITDLVEAASCIETVTTGRVMARRTVRLGGAKNHAIIGVFSLVADGDTERALGAYKYVNDCERTVIWRDDVGQMGGEETAVRTE